MRNLFHTLIIILSAFLFLACENAPVRREEMLFRHPEWNEQMQQLIRSGYLVRGMSQKQVKAAWGRPCWSCAGTTKNQWGETWEYATQVVFFDKNGNVIRWETK